MNKTELRLVSASMGFTLVLFAMFITIYFGRGSLTGAAVVVGSGGVNTTGIIFLFLLLLGVAWFIQKKRR